MAYIDTVVEVLRTATGPLTTHQISDAVGNRAAARSSRHPSEATITTWLYAITGSHDRPGVHRLAQTASGHGSTCWVCDDRPVQGVGPH